MSLSGHFSSKYVKDRKTGKELKYFDDFRTARIRHADGSHGHYRGGKLVATEDVPPKSKFHTATPVSTLVEQHTDKRTAGEKESIGEKEAAARVRKPLDVNAKKLKL